MAGIVFVVWFRRARINASSSSWPQRRATGWTFWGWIVPIASFFVPFQLMGDIWRAGLPEEQRGRTAWLPVLWWITWLSVGVQTWKPQGVAQPGWHFNGVTTGGSLGLCTLVLSGVLLIAIVGAVTGGPLGGPRVPMAPLPGWPGCLPDGTGHGACDV